MTDLAKLSAFQTGVDAWMDECFGAAIKADVQERCDRFIEEALEFVQAAGYSADRAHALVDYTFGRPIGEINQEVGGVMVTLAAMCNTLAVDIGSAAEAELVRVWTKVEQIRAKQAAKPTGSALPVAYRTGQLVERDGVAGELATQLVNVCGLLEANVRTKSRDDHAEQLTIVAIRHALTAIKGGDDAHGWTETPGGHHAD